MFLINKFEVLTAVSLAPTVLLEWHRVVLYLSTNYTVSYLRTYQSSKLLHNSLETHGIIRLRRGMLWSCGTFSLWHTCSIWRLCNVCLLTLLVTLNLILNRMTLYGLVNPEDGDSTHGNFVPVETAQCATRFGPLRKWLWEFQNHLCFSQHKSLLRFTGENVK
jgi:hypothetical protein